MKRSPLIFAAVNCCLYLRHFRVVMLSALRIGYLPNIANPQTYAERMLWRKIVDRNPKFITFNDKLAAKAYVREHWPEVTLPRTLWEGRAAAEIPEELLRGDVMVKANHGCGYNYPVRSGTLDKPALDKLTQKWMQRVYGRKYGQWEYDQIKPRLFVEEAIGDAAKDLLEFNIRASNGKAVLGSVMGRCKLDDQWYFYLDPAGNPMAGTLDSDDKPFISLPPGFNALEPYLQAVQLAEKMSVNLDYARFDFMWNGRQLYGGEITVYPASGVEDLKNASCTKVTLNGWNLLCSHFLTGRQTGWKKVYAAALRRQWESRQGAS
ncbi:MAG TPA: ATP-grasp fold amidoligase family protein [Verrucomicrobiae bacterium]|nr:ATP-grasp fold amidoligase family protein [Verrucomicrobiae bacterium]